jgi:preprotein translocase subunit SecG
VIYILYLAHFIVCIVLIFVVLLQSGKAADLAGAFGGGGSQTALGSRGAVTFLAKATSFCAIAFMLTSLGLALYGSRSSGSVLESVPVEAPAPAPAAPATTPAATATPGAAPGESAPAAPVAAPAAPSGGGAAGPGAAKPADGAKPSGGK